MIRRFRTRSFRRKIGYALCALGLVVWVGSAGWPSLSGHDVTLPHFQARALGVVGGGAILAVGIILIVTAV